MNKRLLPPADQREPKELEPAAPKAIDSSAFQWSVRSLDREYNGEWDWDLTPKEVHDLLDLLSQTSRLTWREVKELRTNSKKKTRPLHHDQPVSSICADAQRRLLELELDPERVFRLRHGNLTRVWGYTVGPVFNIIWFDRAHKVCPMED